mgnify:FL=1
MAKKNGGGLPAKLAEAFEADSGSGFEGVTTDDLQIPFIRLIQALSPQIDKSDSNYIQGSGAGDIFNTVTKQHWAGDEGVVVLPALFQMKLLEFIPRTQGGGFVGELSPTSDDVKNAHRDEDSGMELLPSGNELVRTAQYYVKIVHDDGTLESAILDMKKTQLKKSRAWLTLMQMQKHNGKALPMFANTYRLTSVKDENDKGKWFNWSIAKEGSVPSIEAYNEAKEMHQSVVSGELAIAPPQNLEQIENQSDSDVPF